MPIALERVSHTYAQGTPFAQEALAGISLEIDRGELVGIMGRTGCGKTTLVQLMAGLLKPTAGRVLVNGKDVNAPGYDRAELRRALAMVFQFPEYQLFETTVERDVAFGLRHLGLSEGEKEERVRWALEKTGFSFQDIRGQSPMALSGGEKRRVAIAGALAVKPEILVFDEPIAGLDPLGREAFLTLIRQLNRQGTTILMVSHSADSIAETVRRVLVLNGGRLVRDGAPEEVFCDVTAMEALRVGVSGPRRVAELLRQAGVDAPKNIVRYQQLLSFAQSAGEEPGDEAGEGGGRL